MTGISVASSPTDQDHLSDIPSEVENDQKVTRYTTARQGEGIEERYQGREQSREREIRHGCLDYKVLPRIPTENQQQRRKSLNSGSAGNRDTGRPLKDSI